MKRFVAALVFAQLTAISGFCQAAQTVGSWSISSSADGGHRQSKTVIQTKSEEQGGNDAGRLTEARMDAICLKGKLDAIAVETNFVVNKQSVDVRGAADTTLVGYEIGNNSVEFEHWALLDNGRTLSPYSEMFQGRHTRMWASRIADSDTIALHLSGPSGADPIKITFHTAGFSHALSAAGCSY